jgi:hypothetical protein
LCEVPIDGTQLRRRHMILAPGINVDGRKTVLAPQHELSIVHGVNNEQWVRECNLPLRDKAKGKNRSSCGVGSLWSIWSVPIRRPICSSHCGNSVSSEIPAPHIQILASQRPILPELLAASPDPFASRQMGATIMKSRKSANRRPPSLVPKLGR